MAKKKLELPNISLSELLFQKKIEYGNDEDKKTINKEINIENLFEKAIKKLKEEDYIEAIGLLQALLIFEPDNLKGLNNLSVAYSALDYDNKAVDILEKILSIDPENKMAQRNLELLK